MNTFYRGHLILFVIVVLSWKNSWSTESKYPEPKYLQIVKPVDFYEASFGYNTREPCTEGLGTFFDSEQRAKAGCLLPTTKYYDETTGAEKEKNTVVKCDKFSYVDGNKIGSRIQFCHFDQNFTIATGFIEEDGKYNSGIPANDFFYSNENADNKGFIYRECADPCGCSGKSNNSIDCFIKGTREVISQIPIPFVNNTKIPDNDFAPPKSFDDYFYKKADSTSDPDESRERYNQYKVMIMKAAKAFDLDPSLLFCLKHRESKNIIYGVGKSGKRTITSNKDWDPFALSDTGAVGLGQFLRSTFQDINDRILPNNSNLQNDWEKYFKLLDKSTPDELVTANSKVRITDGNISKACDDRCDPEIAIGASALYLRYIFDTYGNKYENKAMNLEYRVFIAGAYNSGPGFITKSIDRGTGPIRWQQNLIKQRGTESRNHMNSIRSCMKSISNVR